MEARHYSQTPPRVQCKTLSIIGITDIRELSSGYARPELFVGAAEGCDLLIFSNFNYVENQDQKIAAFGSSYGDQSSTFTQLTG